MLRLMQEKRNVLLRNQNRSLVSKTVGQSPIAMGSSASYSPGIRKAQSSNSDLTGTGKPVAKGLKENTASNSLLWHAYVNMNTSTGRSVAETIKNPIGTKLSHK